MEVITIYIFKNNLNEKPSIEEIKNISNNILSFPYEVDDLENFAHLIANEGYTSLLPTLTWNTLSKNNPIKFQNIIMLDFDNTNPNKQYTINDLLEDEWMLNNACFYYRTFSDKNSKVDKFRVVFKLSSNLTTNHQVEELYQQLFISYPQSDNSVGQTSRLFFGSNRGYEEINFDNTLDYERELLINNQNNNLILTKETPNFLLLKYKKYDIVKEKLNKEYSVIFTDKMSAINYFKSIDMIEFLELPTDNPFLDILHIENNPSASVVYDSSIEVYIYKVFSKSYPFTGDILRLLHKFLDLGNLMKVVDLLLYITESKIQLNEQLQIEKEYAEIFRKELLTGATRANYPELYDYLKRYKYQINIVLDLIYDYTYLDKVTGEVKYLNYFSVNKLAKLVSESTNEKFSEGRMWNLLNVLVVTEVIQKMPHNSIPKELYDQLIKPQLETSNQIRASNVYQSRELAPHNVEIINETASLLKKNNINISSLSFETIYRLFGEEKANKDYPQAYKPLADKGLIRMSSSDNNLPSKSITMEKHFISIIFKEIESNGYIFEDRLMSLTSRKIKKSISETRKIYNKIKPTLFNDYNIQLKRLTKVLHKELNITDKYINKNIIFNK